MWLNRPGSILFLITSANNTVEFLSPNSTDPNLIFTITTKKTVTKLFDKHSWQSKDFSNRRIKEIAIKICKLLVESFPFIFLYANHFLTVLAWNS